MILFSKIRIHLLLFSLLVSMAGGILPSQQYCTTQLPKLPKNVLIDLPIKMNPLLPHLVSFSRDFNYQTSLVNLGVAGQNESLRRENGIGIAGKVINQLNQLVSNRCEYFGIFSPDKNEHIYNIMLKYNHLLDDLVCKENDKYDIKRNFILFREGLDLFLRETPPIDGSPGLDIETYKILEVYWDACFRVKEALSKNCISRNGNIVKIDSAATPDIKKIATALELMRIAHNGIITENDKSGLYTPIVLVHSSSIPASASAPSINNYSIQCSGCCKKFSDPSELKNHAALCKIYVSIPKKDYSAAAHANTASNTFNNTSKKNDYICGTCWKHALASSKDKCPHCG